MLEYSDAPLISAPDLLYLQMMNTQLNRLWAWAANVPKKSLPVRLAWYVLLGLLSWVALPPPNVPVRALTGSQLAFGAAVTLIGLWLLAWFVGSNMGLWHWLGGLSAPVLLGGAVTFIGYGAIRSGRAYCYLCQLRP